MGMNSIRIRNWLHGLESDVMERGMNEWIQWKRKESTKKVNESMVGFK